MIADLKNVPISVKKHVSTMDEYCYCDTLPYNTIPYNTITGKIKIETIVLIKNISDIKLRTNFSNSIF